MSSADPEPAQAAAARGDEQWDERALSILSAEHASLASARSLAYNEAFTRIGNYLSFLSISFVALAFFAQATSFEDPFLSVVAITLLFDVVIGFLTFGRILGTTSDDLRAVQAMARVRHGYLQIAPHLQPYFTDGTSDDREAVMRAYRTPEPGVRGVLYGLTTSTGMTAIMVALLGGAFAAVLAMLAGLAAGPAFLVGVVGTAVTFAVMGAAAGRYFVRDQAALEVRFPSAERIASESSAQSERPPSPR
jgi:cytochrome c biogenesis protein CcdA